MKNLLVFAIVFLAIIFSCNKKEIIDPCADAQPFKTDFYIQEAVGDSLVKTDKVLQYASVVFEAADTYTSYEWKIGNDIRTFNTKKVSLLFTDTIENVTVRLIATKKPGACFPDDKTIDTVYKNFSVIPWREWPLRGTYIGAFDSNKNRKDSVRLVFIPHEDGWGDFQLININCGCNLDSSLSWSGIKGATTFTFNSNNTFYSGCKGPVAYVKLQGNDTLIVDYSSYRESADNPANANLGPWIKDTFIGIRKK